MFHPTLISIEASFYFVYAQIETNSKIMCKYCDISQWLSYICTMYLNMDHLYSCTYMYGPMGRMQQSKQFKIACISFSNLDIT